MELLLYDDKSLDDINLYDIRLLELHNSMISTELFRVVGIFIKTNEYLKYEPYEEEKPKEKPKPKEKKKEKHKPKEKVIEKEEKKKEIEDTDEKIRELEELGNRDITTEIMKNVKKIEINEETIKKIRTDFFYEKFDEKGNINLELPSTIKSSSGLWNIGKLRQFLLFNLLGFLFIEHLYIIVPFGKIELYLYNKS